MTLSDYTEATGLSLSGASRDLRQLMADGNSGNVIMGDHTHKIWVRSK